MINKSFLFTLFTKQLNNIAPAILPIAYKPLNKPYSTSIKPKLAFIIEPAGAIIPAENATPIQLMNNTQKIIQRTLLERT